MQSVGVEIWLVVGASTVDVAEVEPRGSIVDQCIEIVLFLQAARRVEGQVVIDELAEIGVGGRDVAFFGIGTVERRLVVGEHGGSQLRQGVYGRLVVRSEVGRRQRPEYAAERSAEQH